MAVRLKDIKSKFILAAVLLGSAAAFVPFEAAAAVKCQEQLDQRTCLDRNSQTVTLDGGTTYELAAPVIEGFNEPCWTWNRRFLCVEQQPVYRCDSGADFNTVKRTCNLTSAVVKASTVVAGLKYITSADYSYACSFGAWSEAAPLPSDRECVRMSGSEGDTKTISAAGVNVQPDGPVSLDQTIVVEQTRTADYTCYAAPQTTCTTKCFSNVLNEATGEVAETEVACAAAPTNCKDGVSQCETTIGPDGLRKYVVGPDGRCVSSTDVAMCQAGPIPSCLAEANCRLEAVQVVGVQDNGFATGQEQTYSCVTESRKCSEVALVSSCMSPEAFGWDKGDSNTEVGKGLAEANAAMAKVEGIQKGMGEKDLFIFSGQNLRCNYPVGNLLSMVTIVDIPNSRAFGTNCCKDSIISGSESWFKLGACTADEVKLAVARRKNLAKQIGGDYCSKKSSFPLKTCIRKTKSYCVFDDMLALVVNEQGRNQLTEIAEADAVHTKVSPAANFNLFADFPNPNPTTYPGLDNGGWRALPSVGNKLYYWQYAGYCRTPESREKAYTVYQDGLNKIADLKGKSPEEIAAAKSLGYITSPLDYPVFQECPAIPGEMYYLYCSLTNDSCDVNKLPSDFAGVLVDSKGIPDGSDINWRIQSIRSFYAPGEYGVSATMPADSSFAAVNNSLSEFISATGSCKAATGNCLYTYAVTDKVASAGLGARKRVVETIEFPLYTLQPSEGLPAVSYVPMDGTFPAAEYQADPNRGLGTPFVLAENRFLFHPNLGFGQQGQIHSHVLLEWANKAKVQGEAQDDYVPFMIPTQLVKGTPGWYPNVLNGQEVYFSGGCDVNSRMCKYEIELNLEVQQHPWGSAQSPRCWGFTVDQLAMLDFDRMDLSRWINNLDINVHDVKGEAAEKLTAQAKTSAQTFYNAFSNGSVTQKPIAGGRALITNTDTLPMLSGNNFEAYYLKLVVPSNWPQYYDDQPNNNPVSNVRVDWGDGATSSAQARDGRVFYAEHDYGDSPVKSYRVTVTMDTKYDGPQTLSTTVAITPNAGAMPTATQRGELEFGTDGVSGSTVERYTPSQVTGGGVSVQLAPNLPGGVEGPLRTLSPGTADMFKAQKGTIK